MNTLKSNDYIFDNAGGSGGGSGKLSKDITAGVDVGRITSGTVMPKGMTIEKLIRRIFLTATTISINPATCKVEFDAEDKGVATFQVTITEGADFVKKAEIVKEVTNPDPSLPPTYVSVASVTGWESGVACSVPVNVTKADIDRKFFARYTDDSKQTEMSSSYSVVKENGGTIITLLTAKHGKTNYSKKLLAEVPVDADFVVSVPDPAATTPEIGCVRIFNAAGTKIAESVNPAEWNGTTVIYNGTTSGAGTYTVKGYENATKPDTDFIAEATATAVIEAPYICGVFFDLFCNTDTTPSAVSSYPYPGEKWAKDPYIIAGNDPDDMDPDAWLESRTTGYAADHTDSATGLVDYTDYIKNFTCWMDTPLPAGDPDENFIVDTTGSLSSFKSAILAHKPAGLLQAGFDMADFETKWINETPAHKTINDDCKYFCRAILLSPAEVSAIADSLDATAELAIGVDFLDKGKVVYAGKTYYMYVTELQGYSGGCVVCGPKKFK